MPPGSDELTTLQVRKALAGDLESVGRLVERFSPLLLAQAAYRLGARLRQWHDPEDLVNDVWARVLPRLPALDLRDGRATPVLIKFLTTTLLHRIRDLYEKHLLGKPAERLASDASEGPRDALLGLTLEQSGVVTRAVRKEHEGMLLAALEELPVQDREVLILRGIEQRGNQEVAAILKIDPDTASTRYRRALARLEAALPKALTADFG